MIAFGWSAGDLAMATKVIVKVAKAFKEAGGAADRYRQAQNFLSGFNVTIERMKRYVEDHPNEACSADLAEQLKSIDQPWNAFQQYLQKYERSLSESSQRSRLAKAPRIIQYTINELNDEVARLEAAVTAPLKVLDSMLSLHLLRSLENFDAKVFTSDQLSQLVNAMQLAYKSINMGTESDEKHNVIKQVGESNELLVETLTQLIEERFLRLGELLAQNECKTKSEAALSETRVVGVFERTQADLTLQQRSLKDEMQRMRDDLVSQGLAMKADVDAKKEALTDSVAKITGEQGSTTKRLEAILEKHMEQLQASLKNRHEATCFKSQPKSFRAQLATSQSVIFLLSSLVAGVTAGFFSQAATSARKPAGVSRQYSGHDSHMTTYCEQRVPSIAPAMHLTAAVKPVFPITERPAPDADRSTEQTPSPATQVHEWRDMFLNITPLRCLFWFLTCPYVFYDEATWRTHCRSHWRGKSPPRSVHCTVCKEVSHRGGWDWYMSHMASHMRHGHDAGATPPNFHLFHHLWQQRVINDTQLQYLKKPPHIAPPVMDPRRWTSTREGRKGRWRSAKKVSRSGDDQDKSDRDDTEDGGRGGGGGEGNGGGSPPHDTPEKDADRNVAGNGSNDTMQNGDYQSRRSGRYLPSKLTLDKSDYDAPLYSVDFS